MFIHRGESFGSTSNVAAPPRKTRVPDLVLNDEAVGYTPLPCIQVTQALDLDDDGSEEWSSLGPALNITPASRRSSIAAGGLSHTDSPQGLKARGRTSRRVSLIPGEALEQAHAVLDKELKSRRGSATSVTGSEIPTSLQQVLRKSLLQTQQMQLAAAAAATAITARRTSCKNSLDLDHYDHLPETQIEHRDRGMRRTSTYEGENSITSPSRMKSNQRWLKLRTTVQLSGALSSSMNRAKPTLKREDSFIKRFSTRHIAEFQDTVDQTDDDDGSKTSAGSPKFRRRKKPRAAFTVINPYGNVFFYWLCILTICVLYNLWTAIVREAFPELQQGLQTMWYILDGLTDLTYILDIFLQFRTGYLEQGLIVYDSKKLARHYLESRNFLLDIFSVFPLDLVQLYSGMHPMLRFPRFLKVYRVYNYYYMVESRTIYPNFLRVLNLVHILLLLAHWFGCFYYMLSEYEKFDGEWTYPYKYGGEFRTLTRKYLGSVYWSTLTLTTIGDLPTPESDKHMRRMMWGREEATGNLAETEKLDDISKDLDRIRLSANYSPFDPGPLWDNYTLPFLTLNDDENKTFFTSKEAIQYDSSIIANNISQVNMSFNWTSSSFTTRPRNRTRKSVGDLRNWSNNSNVAIFNRIMAPQINKSNSSRTLDFYSWYIATHDHPSQYSLEKNVTKRQVYYSDRDDRMTRIWRPGKDGETETKAPSKVNKSRRDYRSRLLHIRSNRGYIFTIISYLIGVFIFATIVGQVGNVITNRNANRLEFERLLDGAKLYMRHHKVPREMQRRVQRWYDYSWSRRGRIQGGGDINSALGLLPDKLRTELALHVNLSTLKKVSIFKECQPEFLHDLVLKMKAYIFTPGDLICRKGEVAREMFIIADGILEVISELGRVLTTMKAGDFFGEIGILNLDGLNKRTADVRSVGYSELFSLSRENVLAAMKDYPEAQEILQSLGHKRLREANRQSTSVSVSSSKRGSVTSRKDSSGDEHRQSKKIVTRLKSDVSAIRNAFRRNKATAVNPRDMDNMELDPLTPDMSFDDDAPPSVRRILKKLGRDPGSGSSDSCGGRGVLKRMSHVSDESQQSAIGAGLPLLQRLKLLKEKEEREEKKKQESDNKRRNINIKSPSDVSPLKPESPIKNEETEPPVIGAGLPLFARLKLLKAKEDKDREEAEGIEKHKSEEGNLIARDNSLSSPDTCSAKDDNKKSSSDLECVESSSSNELPLKNRFKSVFQSSISKKSSTPSSSSQDDLKINDLNKGTDKISKELSPELASNNNAKSSLTSAFNRLSKKLNVTEKKSTSYESAKLDIATPMKSSSPGHNKLVVSKSSSIEKIQRSESFKKAMDDGLMDCIEDQELNIHVSESNSSIDDNKLYPSSRIDSQQNSDSEKMDRILTLVVEEGQNKSDFSPDDNTKTSNASALQRKILSSTSPIFLVDSPCPTTELPSSPTREQQPPMTSPNEDKKQMSDGVQKLMSKLVSISADSEHYSHAEDLVRGVRKILRDKIEDVEVAWEARIDNLQQEVAIRDATIQHLTETIVRMQQNGHMFDAKIERRLSKGTVERLEGKALQQEDTQRRLIHIQLSETSNPSSDEEECLFMRCNSIESIIHQSPTISPDQETSTAKVQPIRSWPRPEMRRQVSISNTRGVCSWENDDRHDIIMDIAESSTDDDIFSYSSDDDRVIFGSIYETENEGEMEEESEESLSDLAVDFDQLNAVESGQIRKKSKTKTKLNSKDWEVQMLANKLAQDQRGVARIIDRDISSGKLHSPLADLHEALANSDLTNLTKLDLARLEKIVRKEREKLRQYARMYSLDERPVLEDEFSSLYRSRSQLLLSKSSELYKAGPTERRLSKLLKQLTSLPPAEQFLLDRLVYKSSKSSKSRRFKRQQSLCDDTLLSQEDARALRLKHRPSAIMRRSMSMCSPPPDSQPLTRHTEIINELKPTTLTNASRGLVKEESTSEVSSSKDVYPLLRS